MSYRPSLVLLDSDFIFAIFTKDDANHQKAKDLLEKIESKNLSIALSNLVKQEIATLFSKRCDQNTAVEVVKILENFERIDILSNTEEQIWEIFKSYQKKSISFVDCSNLFLAKKYNCKIASFDNFYHKEVLLS
jgi:predicted nucleic acid-binding protein